MSQLSSEVVLECGRPLRYLCTGARLWWFIEHRLPGNFAVAAQFEGAVTSAMWREALDALQRRHPLLSAAIGVDAHGHPFLLQRQPQPIPLRIVEGGRWESEMAHDMRTPFDLASCPLLRAVVVRADDRSVLVLTAHHALADGISAVHAFGDVLRLLNGEQLAPLLLTPSDDVLQGLDGDSDVECPGHRPYVMPTGVYPELHIRQHRLSAALTTALCERSRREGTTVQGTLSAALSLTHHQLVGAAVAAPVQVLVPVNTRQLSEGLEENFAYHSSSRVIAVDAHQADFWSLAREAKKAIAPMQTREGVTQGRLAMRQAFASSEDARAVSRAVMTRLDYDAMISNLGMQSFGSRADDTVSLTAMWGPAVVAGRLEAQSVGVVTVGGRLSMLHTAYAPRGGLLETMEQRLADACAATG